MEFHVTQPAHPQSRLLCPSRNLLLVRSCLQRKPRRAMSHSCRSVPDCQFAASVTFRWLRRVVQAAILAALVQIGLPDRRGRRLRRNFLQQFPCPRIRTTIFFKVFSSNFHDFQFSFLFTVCINLLYY